LSCHHSSTPAADLLKNKGESTEARKSSSEAMPASTIQLGDTISKLMHQSSQPLKAAVVLSRQKRNIYSQAEQRTTVGRGAKRKSVHKPTTQRLTAIQLLNNAEGRESQGQTSNFDPGQ